MKNTNAELTAARTTGIQMVLQHDGSAEVLDTKKNATGMHKSTTGIMPDSRRQADKDERTTRNAMATTACL